MMIPSRVLQTNFTSGEISPRLYGRVDLEQYGNGAAILENFQVLNAGGITRRPGSGYCGSAVQSIGFVRMIRFVVSDLTAYVLEFGAGTMRFWRNRGLVIDAGGNPLTVATPWTQDQLRAIRFTQSADVMYLVHPNVPSQKLSRTASNAFMLQPVLFLNGPYDSENTGDVGATGAAPAAGTVSTPPASTDPAPPAATGDPGSGGGGAGGTAEGGGDSDGGGAV